jgi:K+-sensing histidine kinase KdpD
MGVVVGGLVGRVREKAREAKEERRVQQLYAAERAERIREAAEEQRKWEAAQQRARTMLPIVLIVSNMDALAARLIRYRHLEKVQPPLKIKMTSSDLLYTPFHAFAHTHTPTN